MVRLLIAFAPFAPWSRVDPEYRLATCFGGGGAFGIGFDMGFADALVDNGIPVGHGPMIGTSAGAWTAASLATGVTCEQIFDLWDRHPRTRRLVRVIDATRSLFGERMDPRVWGMAVQVPFGLRTALWGGQHSLADVVSASSSVPGFATPHRIGVHRYIDAGIFSSTSADRAKSARLLVVAAPVSGHVLGAFGWANEWLTRYEIARWRQRTGGDVLFARPTPDIAALVARRGIDGVLDPDVGRRTYEAAYELGCDIAERFHERHPDAERYLDALPAPAVAGRDGGARNEVNRQPGSASWPAG